MGKFDAVIPRNVADMNLYTILIYHSDGYCERILNREQDKDVKYCQNSASFI